MLRANGYKLKEYIFILGIRKKLFTMRIVIQRNRLSRELVDAPSLEIFKFTLDGNLGSLFQWKVTIPMAEDLNLKISKVSSNQRHYIILPFCDSMVLFVNSQMAQRRSESKRERI